MKTNRILLATILTVSGSAMLFSLLPNTSLSSKDERLPETSTIEPSLKKGEVASKEILTGNTACNPRVAVCDE